MGDNPTPARREAETAGETALPRPEGATRRTEPAAQRVPPPPSRAQSSPPDRDDGGPNNAEQEGDRADTAEGPGRCEESAGPSEQVPEPGESGDWADGVRSRTEAEPAAAAVPTGRRRLKDGLWPPRFTRPQLIVAVLLLALGFGLTIQVRSTNEHSPLRGARQEDLVRILSELDDRTERLEEEKRSLENQWAELENSSDQAEEARRQTERKARQLGILAGTVPAAGPGITITIRDSVGAVQGDMLLDAIQELRAAGAEAIQVNDVRVVASTHFSGDGGEVRIDGRRVTSPYRFRAIGNPEDLEPALNIPGGVVQSLQKEQATVLVERKDEVRVDALRSAESPDYARSSSQ